MLWTERSLGVWASQVWGFCYYGTCKLLSTVVDNVDRFIRFLHLSVTHICLVSESHRGSQITVLFPRIAYWCFFFPSLLIENCFSLSFCTTITFIPFPLKQILLVFLLTDYFSKEFSYWFWDWRISRWFEVYWKPSPTKPRHCVWNSIFLWFTVSQSSWEWNLGGISLMTSLVLLFKMAFVKIK